VHARETGRSLADVPALDRLFPKVLEPGLQFVSSYGLSDELRTNTGRLVQKVKSPWRPRLLIGFGSWLPARGVSGVLQSQTEREARQAQAIAPPTNAREQSKQYVEALT